MKIGVALEDARLCHLMKQERRCAGKRQCAGCTMRKCETVEDTAEKEERQGERKIGDHSIVGENG